MISIIVPVYNSDKYLSKCVESVINQTYKDWELLLIDDGSTDNSGIICDYYSYIDSRVKVYHNANRGVSFSRNFGIEKANGEWITFLDADDFFYIKCLETCFNHIKEHNLQLLQFGRYDYWNENKVIKKVKSNTGIVSGQQLICNHNYNVTVWGSIIHRDLILSSGIRFETTLKLGEDVLFVINILYKCIRTKYIDDALIFYRQNTESVSHHKKSIDIIKMVESFIDLSRKYVEVKPMTDKMITMSLVSIISNNDISYKKIRKLYSLAEITETNIGLEGNYLMLAKYSHFLAFVYLRFKFWGSRLFQH